MSKPGINSTTFQIRIEKDWFAVLDIIEDSYARRMKVIEPPYRKWYQLLFQYLTLGFYGAPWYYKLEYLKGEL